MTTTKPDPPAATAMTDPKRLTVTPMRGDARQVVLSCSCVVVGRLFMSWESDADALARLLADHRRRAPLCTHPDPVSAGVSR